MRVPTSVLIYRSTVNPAMGKNIDTVWASTCQDSMVSGCGLIVSWNFKHIVNFSKIALYNGINGKNGFATVSIHSPLEVIKNNEE